MQRKQFFTSIILISILLILCVGTTAYAEEELNQEKYEKAHVLSIQDIEADNEDGNVFQEQIIKAKVLSGKYKGQVLEARNTLSGSPGWDVVVEAGDEVILYITEDADGAINEVYVSDLARDSFLKYLIIGFILCLVIIGGIKGIKALLALGITALAIYKILLPCLLQGYSPLPITILLLVGVTLITMFLVGGLTKKSIAATIGTVGGVIIAGILAIIIGDLAHLTGFATEESRMLLYVENLKMNIQGLLFAGIIIGALGATMDVAISIASSVDEVKKVKPGLKTIELFKAGMNVGRDIMGTMTNTLILAYAGGALPLLLLFLSYGTSGTRIFNSELIATEVVRALVGSIGLIFTVPITALVASVLATKSRKNIKKTSSSINN